jgi:hypothetical protein
VRKIDPYESILKNKGYVPLLFINGEDEDRGKRIVFYQLPDSTADC